MLSISDSAHFLRAFQHWHEPDLPVLQPSAPTTPGADLQALQFEGRKSSLDGLYNEFAYFSPIGYRPIIVSRCNPAMPSGVLLDMSEFGSIKFGTSGLRGLAIELDGQAAHAYSIAFASMLLERGAIGVGDHVFIGRDLRASSKSISNTCAMAVAQAGLVPIDCGCVPTPALALFAGKRDAAALMVTGSHIPSDRNGIKFYRPDGEIDKIDETHILDRLDIGRPPDAAALSVPHVMENGVNLEYRNRYEGFLGKKTLNGLRVGLYQHSSVSRDVLVDLLTDLGAKVVPLGRSEVFVPIDTEALSAEDLNSFAHWAQDGDFDAIISTDGDGDRPVVADARGNVLRGDLVGAITARWLGADCVVTPVTSNSGLEASGAISRVVRTKVGSPYVVAGMNVAANETSVHTIVGFEANGGVLLGTPAFRDGRMLEALPTRDAALPIVACLHEIAHSGQPLSSVAAQFSFRSALSDRLQDAPPDRSLHFLDWIRRQSTLSEFEQYGGISKVDELDGVRLFMKHGQIVHFRQSGNAPEMRCYIETADPGQAKSLLLNAMKVAADRIGASNQS